MAGTPALPDPRERGLIRLLRPDTAPANRAELIALIDERAEALGAALAAEAAASDDVHDAASAAAYLKLRLSFLAGLIPETAMARLRTSFRRETAAW